MNYVEAMKQWREVLEELVPDPQCDFGPAYEGMKRRQKQAIASIDQAIAEAEKEKPIAWLATRYEGGHENLEVVDEREFGAFRVYTHPQPKEPT